MDQIGNENNNAVVADINDNDNEIDEDFDEEDNLDEIVYDQSLQTPIGLVNEFSFMKTIFNQLFNQNKSYYNQIINVLTKDQQLVLKSIFDG